MYFLCLSTRKPYVVIDDEKFRKMKKKKKKMEKQEAK